MSIATTVPTKGDVSNDIATPPSGIGLSDPVLSSGRRKMLDLINRLHSIGYSRCVQRDIDLPMIAVIGSQSVGKSSLIESISGITLPRANGICTRCPIECKLSYSAEPWRCIVSLRFITDELGQPLGQARNEQFGDPIYDKAQVEERIRRAQRAVLNPSMDAKTFSLGFCNGPQHGELSFSMNCVSLQISGHDVADLSFCDLPGLISSVGKGSSVTDIALVKNLVTTYISKQSCIILLTVACEMDFEKQDAHHLAKIHDPDGRRIIGVLTKPDGIPLGEEGRWMRFIKNEYEVLDNGWFTVKQPDSRALTNGVTWAEARQQERDYFLTTQPWSDLDTEYLQRLGTSNLTDCLSTILSDLIAKRLPELQHELQRLLQNTEDALRQLPSPPSNDSLAEVLRLISDFARELSLHMRGIATAPDFRPYESSGDTDQSAVSVLNSKPGSRTPYLQPDFLSNEEPNEGPPSDAKNAIYIDQVMHRAQQAITRELPDHYPFVVSLEHINAVTAKWNMPTRNLFDSHFSKFSQGGLQQHVTDVVNDHIKKCCECTIDKIMWLLALEQQPATLNGRYYSDYRDKFLAHYREYREIDSNGPLVSKLQAYKENNKESPSDTTSFTNDTHLMLLPPDPYDPALNIMASVHAYFQVAYKRFVDYVPMAIDHELVLGLDRDGRLESILLKELGITGPEGTRRCKEYLQEPHSVVMRRQELRKRWERLNSANKELVELWL
ncbi:uncharacterized protein LAESUDRAFT_760851 [Laetiporus sulphureus 93-53]|uniref:P-loop containing nucleoside triphosphate hydrolase protein n=1 Tax=Laetiporus sulphureus 93-53 TaxID=1314785 RepID=A0A165DGK5_9APHY|nr:uncharacterized protein LAESUDRAFT_760851 [Laetiporus sulphureus 93-53]KZT04838.1 hypothetical protein LAESUDRAFT_760851 [Laetiporus sulphureus 93-53]